MKGVLQMKFWGTATIVTRFTVLGHEMRVNAARIAFSTSNLLGQQVIRQHTNLSSYTSSLDTSITTHHVRRDLALTIHLQI